MARVRTGQRSPKEDQEALEAQVAEATQTGAKLIEEDGKKFLVEETHDGMTIKQRIA